MIVFTKCYSTFLVKSVEIRPQISTSLAWDSIICYFSRHNLIPNICSMVLFSFPSLHVPSIYLRICGMKMSFVINYFHYVYPMSVLLVISEMFSQLRSSLNIFLSGIIIIIIFIIIIIIIKRSGLCCAASGVVATVGDRPVHRLREFSLNLCTGRPPAGVVVPDAVWYNFDLLMMST